MITQRILKSGAVKKILIVAAHPDDEILGCGGFMAKLNNIGHHEIHSFILGEGATSRFPKDTTHAIAEAIQSLHKDCDKVASFMNYQRHKWLYEFPDNKFDSVSLLEITQAIEEIIKRVNPYTVFTHFAHDLNIDHRITFQAVMTACRPLTSSVKEIFSFEVPSSTALGQIAFKPNFFVDIEKELETKLKAFSFYKSEIRKAPHPRSLEGLKTRAAYWGQVCGLKLAEPFILVRRLVEF